MEVQLRLADRRQLLTGSALSRVQEYGVQIMLLIDARDRAKDKSDRFREMLAVQYPKLVTKLFPEWYRAPDQPDPAAVEWSTPRDATEAAEIEEWIRTHSMASIAAPEIDPEGGWM